MPLQMPFHKNPLDAHIIVIVAAPLWRDIFSRFYGKGRSRCGMLQRRDVYSPRTRTFRSRLVVGLLQRRYPRWLALDCRRPLVPMCLPRQAAMKMALAIPLAAPLVAAPLVAA